MHAPKGSLLLDQLHVSVCLLEGGTEDNLHVKVPVYSRSWENVKHHLIDLLYNIILQLSFYNLNMLEYIESRFCMWNCI